jgi:HAD superfamily hydrolase (TIGR01509 family)
VTIRAVVFDFDGVIANSEPLHYRGFRDVLAGEGVTLDEHDYYTRYLGFDDAGVFQAIASDRGLDWQRPLVARLMERKAARLEELEREASVLFPGARTAIERLSQACTIAIASGALRAEILRVLEREQLAHHFAAVVAAEDTPASKPAPDPYLRAVDLLSASSRVPIRPRDCVAIEDSQWGLQSAKVAGLRTVAITHTYPATALPEAELVVDHLDALTWERLTSAFG